MKKVLALVLMGAVAFGIAGIASAGEETQDVEFKISPTKLSKNKPQNIKWVVSLTTFDRTDGSNQPPSAQRTVLNLPKQFKLNNRDWPYCKTDELGLQQAPTVEDAKAACGKKSVVSVDSGSMAEVTVGDANPDHVIKIDVDVVAFNEKGDRIYLYSKPTGVFSGISASILVGKLKDSKAGSAYKKALDVDVPPLSAGAISFFQVTIAKSEYIQAKCKPKKLQLEATQYFSNAPPTTDTPSVKCKPKA
jgi:hypothetical protein